MLHHLNVRAAALAILLGFVLLFGGCFTSKFTIIPLDQAKVDRAYVGDWDAVNAKGEHTTLVIRNIDDKSYSIQFHEKQDTQTSCYVGFLAPLKGVTFAHMRYLPDDGKLEDEWLIIRLQLTDGKLTARQLSEQFFKGKTIASSDQLRQTLEQNLDNAAMYADDEQVTATRIAK